MHWLYLAVAVVFEITVAIAAGKAQGFTNVRWTITTLISGGIATYFLSLALLTFDVGVGYALWTSVAGVGIVLLGAHLVRAAPGLAKADRHRRRHHRRRRPPAQRIRMTGPQTNPQQHSLRPNSERHL